MIGVVLFMLDFYCSAFSGEGFIEDGLALGGAALSELVIEMCLVFLFVGTREFVNGK